MIVSMTAFGRLEESGDWGHAIWEIKSVNHRYLEMAIRLPEDLRILENKVREQISSKLNRGKVDCNLRYEPAETGTDTLSVNDELINKLITTAQSIQISSPAPINPVEILRWPGVIKKETLDPELIGGPLLAMLDNTLDIIFETRRREGQKIEGMILERCTEATNHVNQVRAELPRLLESNRQRIITRVQEVTSNIDNDRIEQEIVLLAQKIDVTEELDRLDAHIEEVKRVLKQKSPVGRRLDFLMQEMNREANTLGSKAASIELSNASVELKVLIEQMREQIQNIE